MSVAYKDVVVGQVYCYNRGFQCIPLIKNVVVYDTQTGEVVTHKSGHWFLALVHPMKFKTSPDGRYAHGSEDDMTGYWKVLLFKNHPVDSTWDDHLAQIEATAKQKLKNEKEAEFQKIQRALINKVLIDDFDVHCNWVEDVWTHKAEIRMSANDMMKVLRMRLEDK
jgi:hypothetical protein